MSNVRGIFTRRKPASPAVSVARAAGAQHLENVCRDAEDRLLRGEWNEGLRSLVHAVFVAGTEGGLSELELARWTNRLYDAGCLPEEPGAA